jgi:hypothetical protein
MAKPMFWASPRMAVLMPITWPVGVQERPAAVAGVDGGVGLESGRRG